MPLSPRSTFWPLENHLLLDDAHFPSWWHWRGHHTWANASAGDNTEHIHYSKQNYVAKVFHNAKTSQQSRWRWQSHPWWVNVWPDDVAKVRSLSRQHCQSHPWCGDVWPDDVAKVYKCHLHIASAGDVAKVIHDAPPTHLPVHLFDEVLSVFVLHQSSLLAGEHVQTEDKDLNATKGTM